MLLRPLRPIARLLRTRSVARPRRWQSTAITAARTRFAPSPTGFMHLGSLRTALFNYLLAKSTGGQFILRIEDTDKKRTVEGSLDEIRDTLRWAGLQWDEGPDIGGPHGPYEQSQRGNLYRKHAKSLIQSGHAYRCFCAPERLQIIAESRKKSGLPTDYDRTCYHISPEESAAMAADSKPFVIRLKTPEQYPEYTDLIYGEIKETGNKRSHSLGFYEDPILLKSDQSPTYHLANVVDDHIMKITHVVRGTEWMPSTPKHVFLYQALGWEPPAFVHCGLLTNPDKSKLSKRYGDVFVSAYRKQGYFPEALNNFIALQGWSHDEGKDFLTLKELVKLFNVNRLTKGNTVVQFDKLDFLQRQHAKLHWEEGGERADEIFESVKSSVKTIFGEKREDGAPITDEYIREVLNHTFQNYILAPSFVARSSFFYRSPNYTTIENPGSKQPGALKALVKYLSANDTTLDAFMEPYIEQLESIPEEKWDHDTLHEAVNDESLTKEVKATLMRGLRLLLSGTQSGPSVAHCMAIIGRERSLQRIRDPRVGEAVSKMIESTGERGNS